MTASIHQYHLSSLTRSSAYSKRTSPLSGCAAGAGARKSLPVCLLSLFHEFLCWPIRV